MGSSKQSGLRHLARDAVELGARSRGRAGERLEPVRAVAQDAGQIGQGLQVVDDGRAVPQALDAHARSALAGIGAQARDSLDLGRGLAADVAAGAAVHVDVAGKIAAQDVFPKKAVGPGHGQFAFEEHGVGLVGRADEKDAEFGSHGIGAQQDTLDDQMRVHVDEDAVLEGAGLHLVGIDHHIARPHIIGRNTLPFASGRETGSAPTAQVRRQDHVQDLGRGALAHGIGKCPIAAAGAVLLEGGRPAERAVGQKHLGQAHLHRTGSSTPERSSSKRASTRCGVRRS